MIAYISPLVPKRTGIALYSQHLINALQTALADKNDRMAVFDDDVSETNRYQSDYQAQEILPLLFEQTRREKYRQFIYHFGNNPSFHLSMLQLLQIQKGIVVLHDTVLYYLIAGQGTGGIWQALTRQSTDNAFAAIDEIVNESEAGDILRYASPAHYPMLHDVLEQATAVVVHSKMAQQQVIKAGFNGAIHQVPLIDYQQAMSADETRIENAMVIDLLKQKISHGTFIIGLFGFAGQTKRSHSIFQALSELPDKLKAKLKLLIIGNDLYQSEIDAMGLSDIVVNIGYVSDTDYDQSMAICDLIINLRYPSMGETSAVQIQAMSAEKATIVSNYGWFSELADHAVHKISVAEQEVEELKQAIIKLADDESYRLSIAQQAKHYVTKYHSPAQVAQQWMDIICDRKGAL